MKTCVPFSIRLMAMNDQTWERHANPWSVYSRIPCLLFLTMALWSRAWLGWWSLLPTFLVLSWIWINPRAFPPPRSTRNWASEATFGERIWLKRKLQPIPREHDRLARILTLLAASGMPILVWGIWKLDPWPTTLGLFVTYTGKLWFLDRMVWLYRDTAA
jgi:polyferredoxin